MARIAYTPAEAQIASTRAVFDSGDAKAPYKFTTQVQVVPDVLPHSFEEFRKTLK